MDRDINASSALPTRSPRSCLAMSGTESAHAWAHHVHSAVPNRAAAKSLQIAESMHKNSGT
jgi:hypothetical protein